MGRLAKQILADIAAMKRGAVSVTESPIGDRGESRPPAGQPNGRILFRLSRQEHARLVHEAQEQGVSLNHYLTEIVCGRGRNGELAQKSPQNRRKSFRRRLKTRKARKLNPV